MTRLFSGLRFTFEGSRLTEVQTIVEISAILVAVAFAVLVRLLVPVLIQSQTVAESEQNSGKMKRLAAADRRGRAMSQI